MGEAARKPTSKPISVSPSLRALRVNRPEATRRTRATSARGAGRRPRASGRSTRSARRHEGTEDLKNWAAHISEKSRLISLCWTRLGGVRNGRDALVASVCGTQMLRMRRFGKDRCGYDARNTGLRHNRSLPRCRAGIDGPVYLASTIIRSFPVPLQWVKQRASQPQNQSPCPRASARSVLTGRRPRDVPAPPRRVARKGGTSRNREAVPPWMESSDHTTSLTPSRFSATRRGGAGTSRTYTTQPSFPHRFFQSTAASRAMSRR